MNGSFETVKEGLPVNWNYYTVETVSNGDFTILTDSSVAKNGRRSLKFQVSQCNPAGGRRSPGFFKEFKAIPGEMYKVGFWAINRDCHFKVCLSTGMMGNPGISDTIVRTRETCSAWKYFDHEIRIPGNNDNLRIEVNILSPGTIWFDDINIEGVNDKSERTVYPYRGDEECK